MKIQIKGTFTNGKPFVCQYPKESISQAEAETLFETWETDILSNTSTTDGAPIDFTSLAAEIIDTDYIEPVEITRLCLSLYRHGLLDAIDQYMTTKNGEVNIWWKKVKSVDFYHNNVQKSITDLASLGMTESLAKQIFKEALLIE